MAGQLIARGENTWLVRAFLGRDPISGKRRYHNKTIKGTKKEAQRYLTSILHELNVGTFVEPSTMTLNAFLDQWLETSAKPRLRVRTFQDYERKLALHVRPSLGGFKLSQIKPLHLQGLYSQLQAKGLSPRTVRYVHAILHSALGRAVKWQMVQMNVAAYVDKPKAERPEMKVLTPEQAMTFLDASAFDRLGVIFELALSTGMRPGEYLGLTWSDVDFKAGTVVVQRTLVMFKGGWHFGEPKTSKSRRTIPVPQSTLRALKEHRAKQATERLAKGPAYQNHDLVFATSLGTPLSESNLVKRHFKPILKSAGLPEVRLYDLRHTCATLLLASGENPKVVSERLGHASITLTLDTYSHVLPTMQQAAAAKLEAVLYGAQ